MMLPGKNFKTKLIYSLGLTCVVFLFVNVYLFSTQVKHFETTADERKRNNQHGWTKTSDSRKEYLQPAAKFTEKAADEANETPALHVIGKALTQQVNKCSECFLKDRVWNVSRTWITARQIHGERHFLGQILERMSTERITEVRVSKGGTQLKLLLYLEGGQKVLFKPQRFTREHVIYGEPYAGADRHNGEIAAFHLNRLLNFRRSPLVIGRRINLTKEVIPVTEERLFKTFLTLNNKTCFYGVCHYCTASDPVCADKNGILEGSITLWLPPNIKLKAFRHPWSRTYRDGIKAPWETHMDFCRTIKNTSPYNTGFRLLDLIDTSIFDFLIGNADRHRYEVFEGIEDSIVLLLDNGKSFGNPFHNEISILAPLYQCCMIRKSTWDRINLFENNVLGTLLKELMSSDPITPILTDHHLLALDQRLSIVKEKVHECFSRIKKNLVLVDR